MTRNEALRLRAIVETAVVSLDDKTASEAATLFPRLRCDKVQTADTPAITAGTRINWHGVIKKAKVTLWDIEAYNPDNAPDYWDDIAYRAGYRIIPDVITVTDAFSQGERGWWGDVLYESLYDSNTYTPEQWAANWEVVQ